MKSSRMCFFRISTQKLCSRLFQTVHPRLLYLNLAAEVDSLKSHTGGIGFEYMDGSWRTTEASHYEKPGEAIAVQTCSFEL